MSCDSVFVVLSLEPAVLAYRLPSYRSPSHRVLSGLLLYNYLVINMNDLYMLYNNRQRESVCFVCSVFMYSKTVYIIVENLNNYSVIFMELYY